MQNYTDLSAILDHFVCQFDLQLYGNYNIKEHLFLCLL